MESQARAAALQFATTLEQSAWETRAESTRCVLRHVIPDYGVAEILRLPGQGLQARVDLPKLPVVTHEVALHAVPPGWNHHARARDVGRRLVEPGARDLVLMGTEAQALFDALQQGLFVELAFGPVGAPAQAVVSLSPVRFLLAVPAFEDCVAALSTQPRNTASRARTQLAALATPRRDVPAIPGMPPAAAAATAVVEDPYIRSDAVPEQSGKPETTQAPLSEQGTQPEQESGSGLELVTQLALQYGQQEDGLSDAGRLELGAFVREYIARKRGDLVLIAGSAADGAQTRRRALEIKGYLVRNGVPATRVLIHVQGEKLPRHEGLPVEPPRDANRMVVWQVR